MTRRRLILHVGLSKSGTTALQSVVATSRSELARHGVAVPLSTRPAVERVLLRPLGWRPGSGFVAPREPDPLARLLRCLRNAAERDVLISSEDLAELDGPTVRSVVALARSAGFEVQVVVTARAWTRQLPSEYQQFLKHRLADTFPDFLDSVRAGEGFYGQHFRLRQDLAQVCARWAADVPPQDMHLVVLPRNGEDKDSIFTEASAILGVPPSVLPPHHRDVNGSYGVVEAEVYRRLNVELARLLPGRTQRTYRPVRRVLSQGALRRGASPRILLPPDHLAWVGAESTSQVLALADKGYCIHGDLRWLLADARDTGSAPVDQRRGPVPGRHRDARSVRGAHRPVRCRNSNARPGRGPLVQALVPVSGTDRSAAFIGGSSGSVTSFGGLVPGVLGDHPSSSVDAKVTRSEVGGTQ